MHIRSFVMAAALAVSFSATAYAAPIFIPTGPKVYTPQPDIITPNPDLVIPQAPTVTTKDGFFTTTGQSSQSNGAVASDKCTMGVIGQPGVRIQAPNVDANCTPLSIATTNNGFYTAPVTTSTANPDLIVPQAPTVTPQPDTCSQSGIFIPGGFGSRTC